MKYWKGLAETVKKNQFGTMKDDGYVPDSIEISEQEYLDCIKGLPEIILMESDVDKLIKYAKKQKWI